MAQSFYRIILDFDIEALNKKNIVGVMDAVYKKFNIYQTLYVFQEVDVDNKFFKSFLKMAQDSIMTDILITSCAEYFRGKYVIVNYATFKMRGIKKIIKTLNIGLKKKYEAEFDPKFVTDVTVDSEEKYEEEVRIDNLEERLPVKRD